MGLFFDICDCTWDTFSDLGCSLGDIMAPIGPRYRLVFLDLGCQFGNLWRFLVARVRFGMSFGSLFVDSGRFLFLWGRFMCRLICGSNVSCVLFNFSAYIVFEFDRLSGSTDP